MSLSSPTPSPMAFAAPEAPVASKGPVFGNLPERNKQSKASQTTFLGANTIANNPGSIGKTLLGQ